MADPISQSKAFTLPPTPELSAVGGQIGGIPGVEDFETAGKKFKTSADVGSEQARLLKRTGQLEQEIGAAQTAQQQYEKQAAVDIARQTREETQNIEAGLDSIRKSLPNEQFHPTQENTQSLATLFSLIGVVGFAMGGQGKMSAMSSLKSMTGMMQGWQQGRKDLWEREKAEFDKNMARTKIVLDNAYRDADRALKTLSKNVDEANALASQSAAKLGGQVGKQILEKQGIERYFNYLDGIKKDFQTAEKLASQERIAEKKAEEQRLRQEALFAQQDKLARQREAAAEARLERRLAEMGTRRDEKALMNIGPALRNIAEQYPEGTANTLVGASNDDKKRVLGSYRALEESEATADFVARNPKAVGALAAAKNFIKLDAIKSLQSDNEAAVVAAKSAIVDQGLDDAVNKRLISKDDAEAAKILQKKLFGLALSDVQGSGQRGSVYLDRQFQNLYDQASRQDTLLKIIRERAEENNRNLRTYRLNVERHNNPEQFPLLESYSQEKFNQYVKERAPASAAVPEKVSKALAGKPEGTQGTYQNKTYVIRNGIVVEK